VQAESGITLPPVGWLSKLAAKCKEKGALLIVDEIQTGFGRTGSLWAFETEKIIPDILLLGKALGGGLPLGCFISDKNIMTTLVENPVLGHITTFGGNPVCCAAGKAAFEVLLKQDLCGTVQAKAAHFREKLEIPPHITIRNCGLWFSLQFTDFNTNKKVIDNCIENGLITDWFLFEANALRLGPPLTISLLELEKAAEILNKAMATAYDQTTVLN